MNRMMLRRRVLIASLMNSGLPLSALPEGSLVAINESGSPVYEEALNVLGVQTEEVTEKTEVTTDETN